MTNAEHIFEWGMSDGRSYSEAVFFKDHADMGAARAVRAVSWARDVYYRALKARDIREQYNPLDIIDAAKLLVLWEAPQ